MNRNFENVAQSFAISFKPDSSDYEGIGKLNNVPDSVIQAFKSLRYSNSDSHRKWIALIFFKIYLDHLRCCHQGYELRNNPAHGIDSSADPLVYELALATGILDVHKRIEFLNSGKIEDVIKPDQDFRADSHFEPILLGINRIKDSISNRLYW